MSFRAAFRGVQGVDKVDTLPSTDCFSSLSMGTSICCKMAFPGKYARKCSFYGHKLIAEANVICSSATYTPPPADYN